MLRPLEREDQPGSRTAQAPGWSSRLGARIHAVPRRLLCVPMPTRRGGAVGRSEWRSCWRCSRSSCSCCADDQRSEWGPTVWRHLLYAASIAEAALLAAALVAVVIQPDVLGLAPSSGVRQFCGWGAVALMVGCGYALVAWLRPLLTRARVRALLVAVPAIVVVAS